MTAERKLLGTGAPAADIITMCDSLRRDGGLEEYVQQETGRHTCKCSGACRCPDCPNKKK